MTYIACGRSRRQSGEAKFQEGAADPAVPFEDAEIDPRPVILLVRRRLAAGRAVIDVGVLEEERLDCAGFFHAGKSSEQNQQDGNDARGSGFVHGGDVY